MGVCWYVCGAVVGRSLVMCEAAGGLVGELGLSVVECVLGDGVVGLCW